MSAISSDVEGTVADYVAVPLSYLRAMPEVGCDLYLVERSPFQAILYRAASYHVPSDEVSRLQSQGLLSLYVHRREQQRYLERLRDNIETLLVDERLPAEERFAILQQAFSTQLHQAYRMADADCAVKESARVGRHIAQLLQSQGAGFKKLVAILRHSSDTFFHSFNVSSYVVLLAARLGIREAMELADVAVGGMLHDLGKRHIPATVLNSPGRLTDAEWDLVRQHPQKGFEELSDRQDIRHEQVLMAYQHHERIDGTGYPVGIDGKEIHLWARLCAVVDVFEAMTGRRSYRKAESPLAVAGYLEEMEGRQLDKEIVRCWTSMLREK